MRETTTQAAAQKPERLPDPERVCYYSFPGCTSIATWQAFGWPMRACDSCKQTYAKGSGPSAAVAAWVRS